MSISPSLPALPRQRVAVAMSGGVDSSVAAAWLLDQGYDVVGLTMRLWDHCETENGGTATNQRSCCGTEDVEDARRVAQTLNIPFYVLAMQHRFEQDVVIPFVQDYAAGRTPNPCIRCNQIIKFQHLLDQAHALGAKFLATGHYAQLLCSPGQPPRLFCGEDPRKDQSYFLANTPWELLAKVRFPLGEVTKEETRRLAKQFGLHLAQKRESQDVCFVPDGDYRSFFRRRGLMDRPGPIRGVDGTVLGQHSGIHRYTIGQRKGLGISAPHPLFVIAMDVSQNVLVVGPESALYGKMARLYHLNWLIPDMNNRQHLEVMAKIRYASPPVSATLEFGGEKNGEAMIHFHAPQRAITPGQACVFYQGRQVLGAGWIESVLG